MPDDDVFRTEFQGKKLIWSIVDSVMIASACGKFRKFIFCTANNNARKGISMLDANYPDKRVMKRHLNSQAHTRATEDTHAACVKAHFPSLLVTQSQSSTMPRAARVTAALRAQTSPSPVDLTVKEWAQERERMETERRRQELKGHEHQQ